MDKDYRTDWGVIAPAMGGGFAPYNAIGSLDLSTGKCVKYFAGRTHLIQEPVFTPRSEQAPEGDGFVMALVNNYKTMSSELHVVDTKDFEKPTAVVHLPIRLRAGLHGNWVDGQDLLFASP